MTWALIRGLEGIRQTHIIPLGDWREHEAKPDCWCKPKQEDDSAAWVRTSLDGREAYEDGTRLPS